ncbi:MAG: MarR family transcriptional regulator [Clostridia bacterium]|nr:MarR family transcriptional regulator [Clostridia bacterium]
MFKNHTRSNKENAMFLLMAIQRKRRCIFERMVENTGLYSSQHKMLMYLHRNNGFFHSQKDLAANLGISPPAAAVTLKKLENQGYISRSVYEDDSRINNIELTDKARQIINQTFDCFNKLDEIAFSDFTDEDIAVLTGYLTKMHNSLKKGMEH